MNIFIFSGPRDNYTFIAKKKTYKRKYLRNPDATYTRIDTTPLPWENSPHWNASLALNTIHLSDQPIIYNLKKGTIKIH